MTPDEFLQYIFSPNRMVYRISPHSHLNVIPDHLRHWIALHALQHLSYMLSEVTVLSESRFWQMYAYILHEQPTYVLQMTDNSAIHNAWEQLKHRFHQQFTPGGHHLSPPSTICVVRFVGQLLHCPQLELFLEEV